MYRTINRNRLATSLGATGLVAGAVLGALGTPATAAVDTTARPMTAVDPNDALLRAAQMPEVNGVQDWAKVATRRTRVSNAQPGALKDLGATDTARRDFALPGGTSTNVVLTFDDLDTAGDAFREVKSWRRHTGDHVPSSGRLLYTGKNTPVEVQQGRGSYFAFVFKSDRASEEGTFEWLGVTRRGTSVSIVAWRVGGQDATYEVDPTIASVQAANATLARLG